MTLPIKASEAKVGDRVWVHKRAQRAETIRAIDSRMGDPSRPDAPGPFLMITSDDWIVYRRPDDTIHRES